MASKAKKSDKEMDADEQSERAVNPASRRPFVLVAVILVSVIMVGSILLPSLSAIVSGMQASSSSSDSSQDAASAATEAATTSSYMDQLDSRYQPREQLPHLGRHGP